jgi:transcriptional regulator with XRE-family HTH domain
MRYTKIVGAGEMMTKQEYVMMLQKGFTQKELANKVGVHQPKISQWLNGVRLPNSASLHKLANVLGEEPEYLLYKLKRVQEF